jgi:hypothetical protein
MNTRYFKYFFVSLILLKSTLVRSDDDESIRVDAAIETNRCYVGESVLLRVQAVAAGARPKIEPPAIDGVELVPIGRDMRQLATTAIGDRVHETMLYRWDYRITPFRVGVIVVPPFRVKGEEKQGVGKPIRFEAVAPPASGRPDTFLGGIGRVSIAVKVEPRSTRVGETVEIDVTLKGEGASGSVRSPAIERLIRPKLNGEIREIEPSYTIDPPERTYRYLFKPMTAGDLSVGPITAATFDPESERYQTRVAPSVKIHVVDAAPFDVRKARSAGEAIVEPIEKDENPDRLRIEVAIGAAGAMILSATAWIGYYVWMRRRDASSPSRAIERLQQEAIKAKNLVEAAEAIQERLAGYLHRTVDAPAGATTPEEAYRAIYKLTDNDDLARRGRDLFSECDDARFGGESITADRTGMIERAGLLVRDLLKYDPRPRRGKAP